MSTLASPTVSASSSHLRQYPRHLQFASSSERLQPASKDWICRGARKALTGSMLGLLPSCEAEADAWPEKSIVQPCNANTASACSSEIAATVKHSTKKDAAEKGNLCQWTDCTDLQRQGMQRCVKRSAKKPAGMSLSWRLQRCVPCIRHVSGSRRYCIGVCSWQEQPTGTFAMETPARVAMLLQMTPAIAHESGWPCALWLTSG